MQNNLLKLLPVALLALSQAAYADQPPSAGSFIKQISPVPAQPQTAPVLPVEQSAAPLTPAVDEIKITVNNLQITGSKIYSEAQLLTTIGFKAGSELSLTDLRNLTNKITEHYRNHGYFVAQAYLPAQDIQQGSVSINVVEGQYGSISLNNTSKLNNGLAHRLFGGLNSGDPIAVAPLENRLLQLTDLPGINVKSTLIPGASVGASDLVVDITPGQRISGSIDADNQGSRYTGTNRTGAAINLNDPTGNGDLLTLRSTTSFGGMSYERAAYQAQIGHTKAGIAYTNMGYQLGQEFASLEASGTAKIASVFGSYPLTRSRNRNLNIQLAFDSKTLQDKQDATLTVTDKKARVLMASLSGDQRDSLGGGGYNSGSLTITNGNIDAPATAANSDGNYSKLSLNALRLQNLSDTVSLYSSINAQLPNKNLDSSEKMGLGGASGVRAYPEGEAYADQGYVLNLEARKQLPKLSERLFGHLQLIGFIDSGSVTLNKKPWTTENNKRTLSGAGVGMNWSDTSYTVKAFLARKLGDETATSAPDTTYRFWIQGVKYF